MPTGNPNREPTPRTSARWQLNVATHAPRTDSSLSTPNSSMSPSDEELLEPWKALATSARDRWCNAVRMPAVFSMSNISVEIFCRTLVFLDAAALRTALVVANWWHRNGRSDALWRPHVLREWPGIAVLERSGFVRDSMVSLYGRRRQLNSNRQTSWLSQHSLQPFIKNYTLLVELSNGDARILSEVLPLEAGPNGHGVLVAMAEGRVQFPFRRDGNLNISLTVIRRSDTKYMFLCKEAAVLDVTADYISFEHPELPPLVKYFLPQEDLSRLWIHYFICLYSEHGREDPSRLWHETESWYMVTSNDGLAMHLGGAARMSVAIPTKAVRASFGREL